MLEVNADRKFVLFNHTDDLWLSFIMINIKIANNKYIIPFTISR